MRNAYTRHHPPLSYRPRFHPGWIHYLVLYPPFPTNHPMSAQFTPTKVAKSVYLLFRYNSCQQLDRTDNDCQLGHTARGHYIRQRRSSKPPLLGQGLRLDQTGLPNLADCHKSAMRLLICSIYMKSNPRSVWRTEAKMRCRVGRGRDTALWPGHFDGLLLDY